MSKNCGVELDSVNTFDRNLSYNFYALRLHMYGRPGGLLDLCLVSHFVGFHIDNSRFDLIVKFCMYHFVISSPIPISCIFCHTVFMPVGREGQYSR